MLRSEIRMHLLDTALRLFNQRGYHATGIDLIIAEGGVAKTTLYRHFETKEDLILPPSNGVTRKTALPCVPLSGSMRAIRSSAFWQRSITSKPRSTINSSAAAFL